MDWQRKIEKKNKILGTEISENIDIMHIKMIIIIIIIIIINRNYIKIKYNVNWILEMFG